MRFVSDMFPSRPAANTDEYLLLHGVKKGQRNLISLDGIPFSIPPQIKINVSTNGKIIKGQADVLTFFFEFPLKEGKKNGMEPKEIRNGSVRVELRYFGRVGGREKDLHQQSWSKILEHPEIGLIEFQKPNMTGSVWGNIYYQTSKKVNNFPQAKRLTFDCQGNLDVLYQCRTSVQYQNGIHLWLFIPSSLIPQWRSVYSQAYESVLSLSTL